MIHFEAAGRYIMNLLGEKLSASLSYHTVAHVEDVFHAAALLGQMERIEEDERQLLLTAAWYHDAGFVTGAKNHEEESCRMVREVLPGFGYDINEIESICGMILATKIPQAPKNHLEEILADADLDYLGRDDFFSIGDTLFRELSVTGVINSEDDWNRLQVRFLEEHHYFTKTAIALRQEKKKANLEIVKAKLLREPFS